MLGLGISFIWEGLKLMGDQPIVAIGALILTFILLAHESIPAMLLLLLLGLMVAFYDKPQLIDDISKISIHLRLPEICLGKITWHDLIAGALVLGLPQAPLTLGNAIIGTVEENNQLFPARPISVKAIALDHGFMNLFSAFIGGIPICHGAGGMAGHIRFGAKTGGALIIMGFILLIMGLFFSDSVIIFFKFFPNSILGVILFFAGLELASITRDIGPQKGDFYIMLTTAGIAMCNMGVAYLAGLLLYYGAKKGILKY